MKPNYYVIIKFFIITLVITMTVYFGFALSLVYFGRFPQTGNSLNFTPQTVIDYTDLPNVQYFQARDNAELAYRLYPSSNPKITILFHGSGANGKSLHALAKYLSQENISTVYTLDMRGHGQSTTPRGDLTYENQLEDDVADFIALLKQDNPNAYIILGGHSSGGGFALRFAGGEYSTEVKAVFTLAPMLHPTAPSTKASLNIWAQVNSQRIIGLAMLNRVGIEYFNHLPTLQFNLPSDNTDLVSAYSYVMMNGYATRRSGLSKPDYKKDLTVNFKNFNQPLLVLGGDKDEVFDTDQYAATLEPYVKSLVVKKMTDTSHLSILSDQAAFEELTDWLDTLDVE